MTLNITILTPTTIYQSADFRLTNPKTGRPVTNRSAKSVLLTYSTWVGFVTYTGVGRWPNNGPNLSDLVAGWLADGKQRSMAEVAARLADEGTKLLSDVQRQTGRLYRHTFTLAGFEGGYARAFIVSNIENAYGRERGSPDSQLTVTKRTLSARGKATVLITGYKPAVSPENRRNLRAVASRFSTDGGRIRRRMEALNAKAAASPASKGLISPDCVVLSFRGDGSGLLQLNNAADEVPSQFPHITHGSNVSKRIAEALKSLGVDPNNARLVQGASAISHAPGPTTVATVPCPFAIDGAEGTSGYRMEEITAPELVRLMPNAINDRGHVVGTAEGQSSPLPPIPWLLQNGQLTRLHYPGSAVAINQQGQVAGTLQGDQDERALVWDGGSLTEFPLYHGEAGVFAGTDSSACAITADGMVAGSVRSRTEEWGRPNTRAAVFRPGQSPTVLLELQAEFGSSAASINAGSQVLVQADLAVFDARTIIWTPQSGDWHYVGSPTANVLPIALMDDGGVLGQGKNGRGEPVAVICRPGGDWERLGTNDGWVPIDINDHGDVVGWAWIDRLQRPWLRLTSGRIVWLPFVIEHHTFPRSINNSGQIIGIATADHGQHAVMWLH